MPKTMKEPLEEIVSLAEVKSFLRITDTSDDKLLMALIKAARKSIEQFTNKTFLQETREYSASGAGLNFSGHDRMNSPTIVVTLPTAPVQKILSVKVANQLYEVPVKNYCLTHIGDSYKVVIDSSLIYATSLVKIEYVAGYASTEDIPEPLRIATIMLVGDLYREKDLAFSSGLSKSVKFLIKPYSLISI